jgi:hypothetical protein
MAKSSKRRKIQRFPDEETWLREFVGFHGTDGVTRFYEEDLGGVSLVRVLEVLVCGSVVAAEKCDGPGTICTVELYDEEEVALILVKVHFVSSEDTLTILSAEVMRELENGPDHAA